MGDLSMSVYYCVTSIEAHSLVKLLNCTKCLMSTQHAVNSDRFQILRSYTLIMWLPVLMLLNYYMYRGFQVGCM